jgi:transcriptional regulator with XRE-family HTH domain
MEIQNFGQRLKEIREQNGMSQNRLAEESGISREYINQLESGKRKGRPSMETVVSLAHALSVEASAFYETGMAKITTRPISSIWQKSSKLKHFSLRTYQFLPLDLTNQPRIFK